jgi:hypothetical protein
MKQRHPPAVLCLAVRMVGFGARCPPVARDEIP